MVVSIWEEQNGLRRRERKRWTSGFVPFGGIYLPDKPLVSRLLGQVRSILPFAFKPQTVRLMGNSDWMMVGTKEGLVGKIFLARKNAPSRGREITGRLV